MLGSLKAYGPNSVSEREMEGKEGKEQEEHPLCVSTKVTDVKRTI